MSRLNCFIDESGQDDMSSDVYLVTLVFHDHGHPIGSMLDSYSRHLATRQLPDVPFHMVDLLHGHGDYENLTVAQRKSMLYAFASHTTSLPITYKTFRFSAKDTPDRAALGARMRRDLAAFAFDHIDRIQRHDEVAIYYDGGSAVVAGSVRAAFDYALARDVAEYRDAVYDERRLLQAADYLTSIELAALRYGEGRQSRTYERFLGPRPAFRRNLLKPARRKSL